MVLVISPLADILRAISMLISSRPMHHVIFELSDISVSINMDETSMAIFLVIQPETFIGRPIKYDQFSFSMSHTSGYRPLSRVLLHVISQCLRLALLYRLPTGINRIKTGLINVPKLAHALENILDGFRMVWDQGHLILGFDCAILVAIPRTIREELW